MTYDEAIAFWFSRINYEVRAAGPFDLKLERMRALLTLLGNPQKRLRIVHIAGTKGKGSTAAMLESVLRAAGYRTGLFTSPHLEHVEERIQVNRASVSHAELARNMELIANAAQELETGPWPPPTFFELSTALGLLHFVHRRVELAILEVGLGGRYDSTNVCEPLVSVVTSIGFDHMAQLGNTLEEIAFQKAGIIKRNVPSVSGVSVAGARKVITDIARELHSPLLQVERDFTVESARRYSLGLLGEHQIANAATVLATIQQLKKLGMVVPDSAIASGLRNVRWPARVEVVRERPTIVLDSAHNVPSTEALVRTMRESLHITGTKRLIFAVSSDKQYEAMLQRLAPEFDEFYLTKYGINPRCVAPELLAEILRKYKPNARWVLEATAQDALRAAYDASHENDFICITGSVFLAGELQSEAHRLAGTKTAE